MQSAADELRLRNDELTALGAPGPTDRAGKPQSLRAGPRAPRGTRGAIRAPLLHGDGRHRPFQVVQRPVRASCRGRRPEEVRAATPNADHAPATRCTGSAATSSFASFPSSHSNQEHARSSGCGSAWNGSRSRTSAIPADILTFSAGLAVLDPGHVESSTDLLKRADAALYRAKQLGRNRIERVITRTLITHARATARRGEITRRSRRPNRAGGLGPGSQYRSAGQDGR